MKRDYWFRFALLLLLLLSACQIQPSNKSLETLPLADDLQTILDRTLSQYDQGKGISAAIIIPGYQPWVGVSGISHDSIPITTGTVFDIGSVHKNFTAAAVLLLIEEGFLSLDDPIKKWLSEIPNIDDQITIRQLLNHSGGVFDMVRHPDYWQAIISDPFHKWSSEEVLNNFLLEPYFPRGEGWHYSTPGYILLRMIIEDATGKDLASIYNNYLWDDIPLENTYLAVYEELPKDTAHGWFDMDGDGIFDELPSSMSFNSSTAGAVYSTPEDLAKWAQALYHDKSVVGEELFEEMLNFIQTSPEEPLVDGYGLGTVRYSKEVFNGLEIWGHSGNAAGYVAASLYLPDYGVSMGIALNTHDGPMLVINDLLKIVTEYLEDNKPLN